jgi:hypothetical protein
MSSSDRDRADNADKPSKFVVFAVVLPPVYKAAHNLQVARLVMPIAVDAIE